MLGFGVMPGEEAGARLALSYEAVGATRIPQADTVGTFLASARLCTASPHP